MTPSAGGRRPTLARRILGHRYRFGVEGAAVVWWCARCGQPGGERVYGDEAEARRYASRLNRGAPGPPAALLSALAGTVHRGRRRPGRGR